MDFLYVVILFILQIIIIVQEFFAFGTAYRMAKTHGDNGVSLFGWLLVFNLAAIIPGLGIYFWLKYKDLGKADSSNYSIQDSNEI